MKEDGNNEKTTQFRKEMNDVIEELKKAYEVIAELKKENEELKKRLA